MMTSGKVGKRTGRAKRQAAPVARKVNYRQLKNSFSPQSIYSNDEVENLHNTSLKVLKNLGIRVLLPEARKIYQNGGARVVDDMVFIGSELVQEALKSAPSSIELFAPNPICNQVYEEGTLLFTPAGGCPNVYDRVRGRSPGSIDTYRDAIKLAQSFDIIHKNPMAPEPQDIPVNLRHLSTIEAQLTLSDKLMTAFARGQGQAEQTFAIIQTAIGLSDEDFANGVWVSAVINSNSPRMLDIPMARGIIDFARAGQMTIITPFCLAGAMAPVTVSGALVLQHAEALAGIVLSQLSKTGAPVSYGGFSSNVDMKSGSPAFGTPEHLKMQLGGGQLARYIDLPWRSAAGSASNISDAQGAHENIMGVWGAVLGGANMVIHGAGWLEGGLTFGFEKFICDIEALQTIAEMFEPTLADNASQAYTAIEDVIPGGHFFATQHTMERFDTAFYSPLVADLENHGNWEAKGSLTADERATEVWQETLNNYVVPKGSLEIADNINDLIIKFKDEGGASPESG